MQKIATTSMSVFRNLDCLSLVVCSNTTLLKLQTVLFLLFSQILRFEMGGAAYLWMRLIHGRLRYLRMVEPQRRVHGQDVIESEKPFCRPKLGLNNLLNQWPTTCPMGRNSTYHLA